MTTTTSPRHPRALRGLHWCVALALVPQWLLGWLSEATADRDTADRLLQVHVTLGVVVCAAVVVRLGVRAAWRRPAPAQPRWHDAVARTVHSLLYIALLLLPLSGYVIHTWMGDPIDLAGLLHIPRLFTPPPDDETWRAIAWYTHNTCAWALLLLVALHVAAACGHEIRQRGWIRDRMFAGPSRRVASDPRARHPTGCTTVTASDASSPQEDPRAQSRRVEDPSSPINAGGSEAAPRQGQATPPAPTAHPY